VLFYALHVVLYFLSSLTAVHLPPTNAHAHPQVLQKKYDELAVNEDEGDAEKATEAEAMANKMIELLTCIENDRVKYTEKRDDLKRMKQRCVDWPFQSADVAAMCIEPI
jgi:hypothetical protein